MRSQGAQNHPQLSVWSNTIQAAFCFSSTSSVDKFLFETLNQTLDGSFFFFFCWIWQSSPKLFYNLNTLRRRFTNDPRKQTSVIYSAKSKIQSSSLFTKQRLNKWAFPPLYWLAESLFFGGCNFKENVGCTEISSSFLCYTVEAFWAIKAYLLHHSIVQDSNPHINPLAFVFLQVTWLPPTLKTLLAVLPNQAG